MINQATKEKRSYTLSIESVKFLEKLHKVRRTRSVSAALDELVTQIRLARGRKALDASVDAYYSAVDGSEAEEWGKFAEGEL